MAHDAPKQDSSDANVPMTTSGPPQAWEQRRCLVQAIMDNLMSILDKGSGDGFFSLRDIFEATEVTLDTIRARVAHQAFAGGPPDTFWTNVAWDDGLAAGDPQKALTYHLRTTQLGLYPTHVYARYVASAWCHAWSDNTVKQLMPQAPHLPIRLEGTPHTGKASMRYISPTGNVLHDPVPYDPQAWNAAMFPKVALAEEDAAS